ncbi:hypothetical protein [Microvirus mar58]|uniref:Uncharacterized protein n=1 Tax=Microvirus mar58 TaxID=2851194 RepID=A0A8F5MKF8_9VIRU|nr:hypothetical protein [Microvirus mar58]
MKPFRLTFANVRELLCNLDALQSRYTFRVHELCGGYSITAIDAENDFEEKEIALCANLSHVYSMLSMLEKLYF